MVRMAEEKERYHGSIVAFEGRSETISTQLRLLPTAPHVVILPGIESYLKKQDVVEPFSARRLVRRVHEAVAARHHAAVEFLRPATAENKRLVFMNGGTVGAQAYCVSAISDKETKGDLAKANLKFYGLVKDGLFGLLRDDKYMSWRRSYRPDLDNTNPMGSGDETEDDDYIDDPIIRAMRAADALDRETESLQPPNFDIDLSVERRTRRYSLPILDFADKYKTADPFYAFGDSMGDPSDSSYMNTTDPSSVDNTSDEKVKMSSTVYRRPLRIEVSIPPPTPSSAEEVNDADMSMLPLPSPFSVGTDGSNPQSPDPDRVVYGEARAVQIRSSPSRRQLRRARSLDRIFLSCEHQPEPSSMSLPGTPESEVVKPPTPKEDVKGHKKRPSSCMNVSQVANLYQPKSDYLEVPKTVFVKASQGSISRSPTATRRSGKSTAKESDIDDDAGTAELIAGALSAIEAVGFGKFEPVLPLTEDLVIHFTDGSRNDVLDLVLTGFKNGSYPILAPARTSTNSLEPLLSPIPASTSSDGASAEEPNAAHEKPNKSPTSTDEYDPYAAHGTYGYPVAQWIQKGSLERLREAAQLPTPAQTPPPTKMHNDQRFYTFSTVGQTTPLRVQNALRSVLNVYFPPEDKSYHQARFSLFPDMESLWNPVFRDLVPGSRAKDGKKIDLILAIGAQRVVKKEFASAIIGQIEKLGTKPSGISRSGRLDLRYLLASVMQAFTVHPIPANPEDNPWVNNSLMATLLISHLDIYLATHTDVRFLLLEYPEEHLSTALALQRLIGHEIMKVAGILDGDDSVTITPSRRPSRRNDAIYKGAFVNGAAATTSPGTNTCPSAAAAKASSPTHTRTTNRPGLPSPQSSSENLSFAKANFLLTSNATDSEIATFISTVWKILISVSEFYIPEHSPRKVASGHSLRRNGPASPYVQATPIFENGSPSGSRSGPGCPTLPAFERQASLASVVNRAAAAVSGSSEQQQPRSPQTPQTPQHPAASGLGLASMEPADMLAVPTMPPMPARPVSPTPSFAPSARSAKSGRSVRTYRSTATARERLRSLRRRAGNPCVNGRRPVTGAGSASASGSGNGNGGVSEDKESTYDWETDGDEDFDMDERRLVPMFHKKVGQKANTRKALKWLGLA